MLTFDANLREALLGALAARKQREWKKGLRNKWQSQLLKFKVAGASPATQRPFQLFGSKSLADDDASDGGAAGGAVDASADAAATALVSSAARDEAASVSSDSAEDNGIVHVVVARGDRRHHRRTVRAQRRRALSGEGTSLVSSSVNGSGGPARSNSAACVDGAAGRRSPVSTDDEYESRRRCPSPVAGRTSGDASGEF